MSKRGKCRDCGAAILIKQDGRLRKHRHPEWRGYDPRWCSGSDRPPEYVLPPAGFMRSTFLARDLPEAIFIGDEPIVGPFCQHCGNPLSMHGDGQRCPDRILHPAFPPPTCQCHGVQAPSVAWKNRSVVES